MRIVFAGDVQLHGQQVGMSAQLGSDIFGLAGGGDDGVAGTQSMFCDQCAETTGSTSNEPSTHINSSCSDPCVVQGLLDELSSL
ncbi:hypothetical protein D3C80_1180260 [compost metagenome]